jgi:hypothetical protein
MTRMTHAVVVCGEVDGLGVVGSASAESFGPGMRFVYGAKHAVAILTRHIRTAARKRSSNLGVSVAPRERMTEKIGRDT